MNTIVEAEFGLHNVTLSQLDGYDNLNYGVQSNEGKFVLKTYADSEEIWDQLDAENQVLISLSAQSVDKYPTPFPFLSGVYLKRVSIHSETRICRMLSFLEGEFLGEAKASENLYSSLGTFLAYLDLNLMQIKNHVISSREFEWDLQYFDLNKKYIGDIPAARDRSLVEYFMLQYDEIVRPVLPNLRRQIIHNDANEWNVLIDDGRVSGIIDFGDVAYSPLINELAIAIAYVAFEKEDPLWWASMVLKAYHKIVPLEAQEVEILYYLIAARSVTSVCGAAHSKVIDPGNVYATSSENAAWKMLYHWLSINPVEARNVFMTAIGVTPETPSVVEHCVENRHKYLSTNLSISYDKPIYVNRSAFQYMYDVYGSAFLDAYNNIPHVGHSHPKIVSVGQRQMARLNTNTRYIYDELSNYAEKLLAKFPDKLSKVYFVNSGSAASDLAIRMAKAHTTRQNLMVMEHGYHGNTQTTIDISDYKFNNPKGQGQKAYIIKTAIPNVYRDIFESDPDKVGKNYAQEAIKQIANCKNPIAAFVSEPIVGCGGQVPLADGYLKTIYPAIRAQGGVCISDEVQTGFGRLGDVFWGYEAHDVVPDVVILGKPMANGHPMGAVVCTDEIAKSFGKGVEFFSSFGGNPVSCAIASAVLDVIEEEELQQNAKDVGDYYKSLFIELQRKYSCIGDVRGSGLFLGIELVMENSKEPNPVLAHYIKNQLRNRFILVSTDGPFDSVIKTKPPLCFTRQNADEVVANMGDVLKTYAGR